MHAQTKASLNDQTGGRNLPESGLALPFETDRHDEPDNNKVSGAKMSDDRYGQYQSASYDQTPQPGNPTYTEAWALVEAARRMALPLEFGNIEEEASRNKLRNALRLNWRLWTIFQTELSLEDEGPVPIEVRESMLNLCNFVDKHTVETINDPTAERVATLIEINRNIANGLLMSLNNAMDAEEAATHTEEQPASDEPSSADAERVQLFDADV